jgi:FkbM family methyltransferase
VRRSIVATSSSSASAVYNHNNAVLPVGSLNNPSESTGWHSIDVFYGKSDVFEQTLAAPSDHQQQWFSQAHQDELIVALLKGKTHGYFVDLAANDAVFLSNTYALERFHQWQGLCIEPNPLYWYNLTFRDCKVVGAVVGQERMEQVYFRFEAGDHGGIAAEGFDNSKRWQRKSRQTYTVTLQEILQRAKAPIDIDYLSLDVEGAEAFILKNFPLNKYKIKLITAERLRGEARAVLEANGFQFLKRLTKWGEGLWAHTSIVENLDLEALETDVKSS